MAGRKKARAARAAAPIEQLAARESNLSTSVAMASLMFALVASSLFVDPRAESAFDAPKRMFCLVGIGVAAVAQFGFAEGWRPGEVWKDWNRGQRGVLLLFLVGIIGAAMATLASPRRGVAIDAYRASLLFVLLIPLGASAALDDGRSRRIAAVYIGSAAINAAIGILENLGAIQLFAVERFAGRTPAVALVGNEAILALNSSCALTLGLVFLLHARTISIRALIGGAIALFALSLVLNQSLTAFAACAAGVLTVLFTALDVKRWISTTAVGAALLVTLALGALFAGRLGGVLRSIETSDWDTLLTFRLGSWSSAIEMIAERPILGFGPGTFGAEFVPHRLAAELRFHRRFVVPTLNSTFSQAHCDYLQGLAEIGVPATLATVAALIALLSGAARAIRRTSAGARAEVEGAVAILIAGAISALSWFPLQTPILAAPLLLAAGRAWRLLGDRGAPAGS